MLVMRWHCLKFVLDVYLLENASLNKTNETEVIKLLCMYSFDVRILLCCRIRKSVIVSNCLWGLKKRLPICARAGKVRVGPAMSWIPQWLIAVAQKGRCSLQFTPCKCVCVLCGGLLVRIMLVNVVFLWSCICCVSVVLSVYCATLHTHQDMLVETSVSHGCVYITVQLGQTFF